MDQRALFIFVIMTYISQTVGNFTDGQAINMVLSSDAYDGKLFLRGIMTENSTVKVVVETAVAQPTDFVIFQAHSYMYPILLAYHPTFSSGDFVNGTDVGLHSPLNMTQLTFYVRNINSVPVDMIIIPMAYKNNKPIPGGCNLSFAVNIAPYMVMTFNDSAAVEIIQVDAQPAAIAGQGDVCRLSSLEYEVYEVNLEDTSADAHLNGILSVVTANGAIAHGRRTRKPLSEPLLRRRFAAYYGFGKILVASVTDPETGATAAYVPIAWYDAIRENSTSSFYRLFTAIFLGVLILLALVCVTERGLRGAPGMVGVMEWMLVLCPPIVPILAQVLLPIALRKEAVQRFVSLVLFPLCFAQLAFGFAIWCGLGRVQGFEGPFVLWSTFACFYMLMFIIDLASSRFFLAESFVFSYALLAVLSELCFGGLVYLFLDSARILTPQASNVIFSNSDSKGDILLYVWKLSAVVSTFVIWKCRPQNGYETLAA